MQNDLKDIKKAYFIGIKGSGVIAIVEIFHSMGVEVLGSDTKEKFFTDAILERLGIKVFEEFSPENIPNDVDLVIYSTAYNENNNIEFRTAREKNIPMASYPEMLAYLFNEKYGIAVCGTHGKTTTSAMLASALKKTGVSPTAVIGSKVIEWDGNALAGKGESFVAETDEYQNKLDLYNPKAAILTSCDFDHPDFFETFEDYKKVFKDFTAKIPKTGFLVFWGDSVDTQEVSKSATCKTLSYGFGEENDIRIEPIDLKIQEEKDEEQTTKRERIQAFKVFHGRQDLGKFELSLFGRHNVLNATAVIAMCYALNLNLERVKDALLNFKGTSRRFEYIGKRNGALLYDDYGHHPEEIMATLKAARDVYPEKNIWAIFHPHTYTRTKALLSEFSQSFGDANKVIVLDIYGSARETQGGVHSKDLVELINKYSFGKAEHIATIPEVVDYLKNEIGKDDVVIAIGAGNGWEVVDKLKEK